MQCPQCRDQYENCPRCSGGSSFLQISFEHKSLEMDESSLSIDQSTEESSDGDFPRQPPNPRRPGPFVPIETVCQYIFDQKPDSEIISAIHGVDPTQINEKNSHGQSILYMSCRAGRVEVIKILAGFRNIVLGGPQNSSQKSTPLHGANWGGHVQVVAMLLVLGAKPEENCVTPDGRGLPPSEEGNPNLPKSVLEQLRTLWSEYTQLGVAPMYKYLPPGWTPGSGSAQNSNSMIFTSSSGDQKNLEFSPLKKTNTSKTGFPNAITLSTTSSSSSPLSYSPQSEQKSHVTKTNTMQGNSLGALPINPVSVLALNYDSIPKCGPQYRRFPYLFYWRDNKGEPHLYDVTTQNKLNTTYTRKDLNNTTTILTTGKTKKFEINLEKLFHVCISDKKQTKRNVEIFERIHLWYWKDDDGTFKPYDDKICLEIAKKKQLGMKSLVTTIGKWTYEINIESKTQKNLKSETERPIWTEEDLEAFQKWWEPVIPTDQLPNGKKAELVLLEMNSPEWNRVDEFFHITMPSRVRSGVLSSRKTGKFKDCHSIVKIEKIVNPTLRAHWEHELQMVKKNNNNDPNIEYVKLLFHGTSKTPPKVIYEADKGWKISYSRDDSLWGRGLYFALDSIYTHNYTFKTNSGTRKVFLAEVIVGDGIHSEEDSTLREPPLKENGKRYDSVIGQRHDTWIWITYDDARAYPTYLVEYQSSS